MWNADMCVVFIVWYQLLLIALGKAFL